MGVLLLIVGTLMLTTLPFSFYFNSGDHYPLLISSGVSLLTGVFLRKFKEDKSGSPNIRKREGYLIVALGWLVMSLFGMLPYLLSGVIPEVSNAFFETISGFTTTGASILNDIEATPKGILFWRSMTQWIGGMGIIVLAVAILPILGIGGMDLFLAESPGPTSDKLHPRIKETAKRLWGIYVFLTILLTLLLLVGKMSFYDALNHALTTMATGGFSTQNSSVVDYAPFIQYVLVVFMFLAGTNFSLIYFGLKREPRKIWKSEEFRAYLFLCFLATLVITLGASAVREAPFEQVFRDALFQVVSLVTTTGFVSADYTSWATYLTVICFALMFLGASAGSTSGGIKIIRHYVMVKNGFLEFKRLLHPRAIVPLTVNGKRLTPEIVTNVLVFLVLYLHVFVFSVIIVSLMGLDLPTSMGAVATTLGNVGPGIGSLGPMDNFSALPSMTKWFLSFLMLVGRLELFTVLILFTPYFWRAN